MSADAERRDPEFHTEDTEFTENSRQASKRTFRSIQPPLRYLYLRGLRDLSLRGYCSEQRSPASQSMSQRAAIDILEFAANRNAMGDAARFYIETLRQL